MSLRHRHHPARPRAARTHGSDLLGSLVEAWPEFLGYLISFAFIGASWMAHAHTTRLMQGSDTLAAGLNLLALLLIALLPFSTSLMVSNLSGPDTGVAVLVYGLNILIGLGDADPADGLPGARAVAAGW